MARQRFIWPDLWTDPVLGRLAPLELVFYIGCFSNADDDGRIIGEPAYLRSTIFPYQDFTNRKVKSVRDRVVAAVNSLVLYENSGFEYLAFTNWREWQKPKYPTPSKLPAPPTFPEDSRNVPEGLEERSSTGWVGLGREDQGQEQASRPSEASYAAPANVNGTHADQAVRAEALASIATTEGNDDDIPF